MTETSTGVRVFRIGVVALGLFYFFLPLFDGSGNFFTRPKALTIWGFHASFAVGLLMLARSYGLTDRRWDGFVGMTIVLNLLVVFLYWRLYFEDPMLVNADGPNVWWREYYFHLLVQILMWIDAFFLFGAWRKIWSGLLWLVAVIIAYCSVLELWVQPRNDFPAGSVTNGLTYPFLNDMELIERIMFYGTTAISAFIFAAVTIALAWALRRFRLAP
ncbi:MAG: hypothetical protein AAF826_07870 [Pseudomonadota bacterium]